MNVFARNRTNPYVSLSVAVIGLAVLLVGYRWIGGGIIVGAVLAYLNSTFLSKRIDAAAGSGNVGIALMLMQIGLMTTMVIIAIVTVILIQLSTAMALGCVGGFAVGQIGALIAYYWQHGRGGSEGLSAVLPSNR